MSLSSQRLMTVTASTKRAPANRSGVPVAHLTNVKIMPIGPRSVDVSFSGALRINLEQAETYADAEYDIKRGDVLVVGSREYPIVEVDAYSWSASETFLQIILDDKAR